MTIPRKGSRTLDIDGRKFRFMVKPVRDEDLSVTVQEDVEQPGRVMQFHWPEGHSVYPSDVAETVRDALKNGWDPSAKGSAFRWGNPKAAAIANDE
jgi:hypothetical protein